MIQSSFRRWLELLSRHVLPGRRSHKRRTATVRKHCPALTLERLEDRVTPTTIASADSGGGSQQLLQSGVQVSYNGGPLIPNVQPQLITLQDNSSGNVTPYQSQIDSYLTNLVSTSGYVSQLDGPYSANNQKIGNGTFNPATDDANVAVTSDATNQVDGHNTISNATIQSLITLEIANGKTAAPTANTLYIVMTPPGDVVTDGRDNSVNGFLGYHAAFTDGLAGGQTVYYAVIPDEGSPNGSEASLGLTQFQGETTVISHELSEAITDPAYPPGWTGPNGGTQEVGDLTANQNYTMNGNQVQYLWSNALRGAAAQPGSGAEDLYINQLSPPAVDGFSGGPVATFTTNDTSLKASDFSARVLVIDQNHHQTNWTNVSISGSDGQFVVDAAPPSALQDGTYGTPSDPEYQQGLFVILQDNHSAGSVQGNPTAVRYQPFVVSSSAPLVYNADPYSPHNFRLVENAGTGNFELYDGANLVFTQAIDQTTDIDVNADPGANSSLTIDCSGGEFSNAVNFDGGTGSGIHTLTIENGSFANETATPTGAASGTITFDANSPITYSHVSTVDDMTTVLGQTIYDGTAAGETIDIGDGGTVNGFGTKQISSEGGTFAPVSFANKRNVTVNGLGGDDTFHLNNPNPTPGLATLLIDGGSGNNTLVGPNQEVIWYITGHNAGTPVLFLTDTISFQNIENLVGGTGLDVFTFAGGALDGTVDGGGGTNTLDYSLYGAADPITVDLQTGAATSTGGFLNVQRLVGGAGSNTLIGADTTNTWDITGQNAGNVNGTFTFYVIENLTGGTGNDSFVFSAGVGVDGTVDGGGGTNTLDYHLYAANDPITVNLQTEAATGIGAFANIQGLIGGAGSNTLIGANTTNTWLIREQNAGDINDSFSFSSIENLTGGTGNDAFLLDGGGSITGVVDGGGGSDTLDYRGQPGTQAAISAAGSTDGFQGTASAINGGFDNINAFANLALLIGPDVLNTWDVTGTNSGTLTSLFGTNSVSVTWSNVAALVGGAGVDTFLFDGGSENSVDGQAGSNTLDYHKLSGPIRVTLTSTGSVTGYQGSASDLGSGFDNIGSLIGSASASDTLTGPNTTNTWRIREQNAGDVNGVFTFSSIENLTGGTDDDNFIFNPGGSVSGSIDGGAGSNTLNYVGQPDTQATITTNGIADSFRGTASAIGGNFNNISVFANLALLTGPNVANTWDITGTNSGTLTSIFGSNSVSGTWSNVAALRGGSAGDNFLFDGGNETSVDGQGGSNTLDYHKLSGSIRAALTSTGSVTGYQGTSNYLVSGFDNINSLVGSVSTSDMLTGPNTSNTWYITGQNAGDVNGKFAFSSIENLTGGKGNDSFVFSDGMGISGMVDGGSGTNKLDYHLYAANDPIRVNLQTDAATGTAGFRNIQGLIGGAGSDTLIADNTTNTWYITGQNAGDVNGTFTFSSIENLTGGMGNDSFVFGAGVGVDGTVDGGGGTNTLDYHLYTAAHPITVNLQTNSATGIGNFAHIRNLIGGAGSDTLIAANTTNTWHIRGQDTGDVNSSFTFSSIENLTGGSDNDSFVFSDGVGVDGMVDGGGGANTLDYHLYTATDPITVNLQTGIATGTGGFRNIQNLVGGAGSDTLIGASTPNTWYVTGQNAGTVNGIFTFSSIENLTGGSDTDSFVFSAGVGVDGTVDGGSGTNTLDYHLYTATDPITVNLQTGAATGMGGFLNIQNLIGGQSVSDTLIGTNTTNTWHITGQNAGDVNRVFTFSSIENLSGGTDDDNFVFNPGGSVDGSVDGGAGNDTLDYGAQSGTQATISAAGTIDGFQGTASAIGAGFDNLNVFANLALLTGPDVANTWDITGTNSGTLTSLFGTNSVSVTWSNVAALVGGAGVDTFLFDGGSENSVDGQAGSNTLDYHKLSGPISVTLTSTGSITGYQGSASDLGSGFGNIGSLIGSASGSDTLTGLNTDAVWSLQLGLSSYTSGGRTLNYSSFEDLLGGSGADQFVFQGGSAQFIDGKGGDNTLDYSSLPGPVVVNLTGLGSLVGFQGTASGLGVGFDNIDRVLGTASGADVLIGVNAAATWTVTASGGSYASGGAVLSFAGFETLVGGNGPDEFDLTSTLAGYTTTLYGQGGDNTFLVGSAAPGGGGVLTGLAGPLTINGGSGNNQLAIDESGASTPDSVSVTANVISSTTLGWSISYGGSFGRGIFLTTGSGGDSITVSGQGSGPLTINSGAGNDSFTVYSDSETPYAGLVLDGGLGLNTLNVIDASGSGVVRYFPSSSTSGSVSVQYPANTSVIQYQNLNPGGAGSTSSPSTSSTSFTSSASTATKATQTELSQAVLDALFVAEGALTGNPLLLALGFEDFQSLLLPLPSSVKQQLMTLFEWDLFEELVLAASSQNAG